MSFIPAPKLNFKMPDNIKNMSDEKLEKFVEAFYKTRLSDEEEEQLQKLIDSGKIITHTDKEGSEIMGGEVYSGK